MSKREKKANKDKTKSYEYQSSELLLEHIQREYCKEDERARAFEAKIPILLTLVTLFLGVVINSKSSEIAVEILNISSQLYFGYMLLEFTTQLSLIISAGCFVYVICLKQYKRLRTDVFTKPELNSANKGKVSYELIKGYQEALNHNISQNDNKGKTYTWGVVMLAIGVVSYVIMGIVNSFF